MNYVKHFASMFSVELKKPFFIKETPNCKYMFTDDSVLCNDGKGWKKVDPYLDLIGKMMDCEYTILEEEPKDLAKIFRVKPKQTFLIKDTVGCDAYIYKIVNNKLYARYRYVKNSQWKQLYVDSFSAEDKSSIVATINDGTSYIVPIKPITVVTSSVNNDDIIAIEKHLNTDKYEISMFGDEGWNSVTMSQKDIEELALDMAKKVFLDKII